MTDKITPALTRGECEEVRRAYIQYCAEQGRPLTWTLRAEVFEALLAAALLPPTEQEDET